MGKGITIMLAWGCAEKTNCAQRRAAMDKLLRKYVTDNKWIDSKNVTDGKSIHGTCLDPKRHRWMFHSKTVEIDELEPYLDKVGKQFTAKHGGQVVWTCSRTKHSAKYKEGEKQ